MNPKRNIIEAAENIGRSDLSSFQHKLRRIAYDIGSLDGTIEHHEQLGNSNATRDLVTKRDKLHSEFRDIVSDANISGHDPHKLGFTRFRTMGDYKVEHFEDNSHMDERDRKSAFHRFGGEQHTAKRSNRENLRRFGNKPGPYAQGLLATRPQKV